MKIIRFLKNCFTDQDFLKQVLLGFLQNVIFATIVGSMNLLSILESLDFKSEEISDIKRIRIELIQKINDIDVSIVDDMKYNFTPPLQTDECQTDECQELRELYDRYVALLKHTSESLKNHYIQQSKS